MLLKKSLNACRNYESSVGFEDLNIQRSLSTQNCIEKKLQAFKIIQKTR